MSARPPAMPEILTAPPPGPALVISPHPDDEIIGPGGALILHARRGDPVAVVVVFDGANGDPDGLFPREGYRERRQAETRAAARDHLGTEDVVFHGFADGIGEGDLDKVYGDLPADPDARIAALVDGLATLIRGHVLRVRPRALYAPWPGEVHPDHWACGAAVQRLVRNEPRLFEGVRVFGYEVWSTGAPDVLVETTAVAAAKLDAVRLFESQTAYADYPALVDGLNRYRGGLLSDSTFPRPDRRAEGFVDLRRGAEAR